jgi:tripartite-type tricarboxylate transporter receptor subunit TctC
MFKKKEKAASFLILGLIAFSCLPAGAEAADTYPDKPITVIVPFPPGGNIDLSARAIAPSLSAALGGSVLIENRPGAGGTIGATMVTKSRPDGYTLLVAGSTVSIAPFIYKNVAYDPAKDFTAIGGIKTVPMVLTSSAQLPVSNLADLRAYSKAHDGNVTVGTSGNGSSPHFALEQIIREAKLPLVHVPYRGSAPALTDLLGNHVNMMVDQLNTSLPSIRDHRIKAIAQLGKERSALIPDVPTLAEQGVPGFDIITYVGLFAPAKLPADVEKKLVAALATSLGKAQVKKLFYDMGATVFQMDQKKFISFVHSDIDNSRAIAHDMNISVE